MKTNVLLTTLCPLVLFAAGCGQQMTNAALQPTATPPISETNKIGQIPTSEIKTDVLGFEAALSDNEGKCRFSTKDAVIDLDLSAGCDFHRRPDNDVRIYPDDFRSASKKKNRSNVKIILIEHSVPNPQDPGRCITQMQGIKIEGKNIVKSTSVSRVASCPPFQWDEKNFTGLFEQPKK